MTVTDLENYYADTLIVQYRDKPNARQTVKSSVEPFLMDLLPLTLQDAFNLDTAVGVQLDVIGKYQGCSRNGYDFSGPVTLSDSDFRQLIKIYIILNHCDGTLKYIQDLLHLFFNGTIFVFDFAEMRMQYFISSTGISTQLAQFIVKAGALPKPMGVSLSDTAYRPSIDNFFGFGTNDVPLGYNVTGCSTNASGLVGEMFVNGDFL